MLMEQVATSLAQPSPARSDLPRPESYYDLLRPLCRHVDIWHTHYNHIIEDHQGVVEWFKGSGMRPFLAPLSEASRKTFLAKYSEEIRRAYRACLDGKVLLRFPRLFMVAAR
jgi:trans-aconitate 2-methyltransferase